jgi:hypothetical protein
MPELKLGPTYYVPELKLGPTYDPSDVLVRRSSSVGPSFSLGETAARRFSGDSMNRRAFLETMCQGGLATFGRPRVTVRAGAADRASGPLFYFAAAWTA